MVAQHAELADLCSALIDLANARGGPDNITVVAAHFEGDGLPEPSEAEGRRVRGLSSSRRRFRRGRVCRRCRVQVRRGRDVPPPTVLGSRARALLLMAAVLLPDRGAARGLALTAPTEARLGTRLGWLGGALVRLRAALLLLQRDGPGLARRLGHEPGGDRPRERRLPALGAQVPLGAAGGPAGQPAALDPGLPGPARGHDGRCSPAPTPARHAGSSRRCSCCTSRSRPPRTSRSTRTPSRPRTAASWAWPTRCGSRAYRSASFVSSALLVWLAARHGWRAAFLAGAALLGGARGGDAASALATPGDRPPADAGEPIRALLARPASGRWCSSLCCSSSTSRRWSR